MTRLRSRTLAEWIVWPLPSWRALTWFLLGFVAGGVTVSVVLAIGVVVLHAGR